ncbi:MAG: hypothetical protein JSR66_22885 [Proteobacteria bacterium]|nr:hypothetical protein [Pseudomonadota bacterium]
MQRLLQPSILTLSLAVPTASLALGLGDIRVESALHQPLVAQIELIGAADDELGRLSAAIASDELFEHYNLERAPFIYGTTLSVGRDAQGRPVLNMRSTEKFTEPVVTLLVDLHTPHGELVREYTLFLDPAGLVDSGSASTAPAPVVKVTRAEPSALDSAAPAASTISSAPTASGSASSKALGHTYRVSRRDTLDRIVTATGARSRIERHRMMIAIFRNNPAAFQNNFNRMHSGVTLTFPTAEQLAAISVEETNREYDAQMAAWHSSRGASTGTQSASAGASGTTSAAATQSAGSTVSGRSAKVVDGDRREGSAAARAAAASIAASADAEKLPTDPAALKQRIASLEQSIALVQQQLKQPLPAATSAPGTPITALAHHTASDSLPASNAAAPASSATAQASGATAPALSGPAPDEAASEDDADETPAPKRHLVELISAAIGAAAVFLAGAWFFLRRRAAYNYAAPKYGTATAGPISNHDESSDSVDFTAATASVTQLPAMASEPVTANAPATSDKASREAKTAAQDSEQRANKDPKNESSWFEDSFSTPIADLLNDPTITLPVDDTEILPVDSAEPTLKLPASAADPAADTEVLVAPDLEFSGNTNEHVVMGSALNESSPVERRKNPVDVLRQAIEREPDRSDLRLKLLELYYSAAAENRRAFLEASRQLSKSENLATPEDWSRISDMGRIIAPDDELFSSEGEGDDKQVA